VKQFGKMMLVTLGFGLLAVVLSSLPNHPTAAAPGPAPVNVVNTGANPVPVSIDNFPATLPVSFTNTSSTPLFVDKDGSARHSYTASCSGVVPTLGLVSCASNVASGSTLAVDAVGAHAFIATGKSLYFARVDYVDAGCHCTASYYPQMTKLGTDGNGFDHYYAQANATLHVSSGSIINFTVTTTDVSGTGGFDLQIAGHFVNP
jgi:hypothetical protein